MNGETKIGEMIRTARQAQRMSIRKLADVVDCTAPVVINIEQGRIQPSERLLAAFIRVLNLPRLAAEHGASGCTRAMQERLRSNLSLRHIVRHASDEQIEHFAEAVDAD